MNHVVANRLSSKTFWYPVLQYIERRLANPVGRVIMEDGHVCDTARRRCSSKLPCPSGERSDVLWSRSG